jgi:hypothetical protein
MFAALQERHQAERAEAEKAARQLQGTNDDPVGTRRLGEVSCAVHILVVARIPVHGAVWFGGPLAAT